MTLPIPIPMAVAVYFTMWWIVLFAILPFGIKSQHEGDDIAPGTDLGAPQRPRLLAKALWTTLVSTVLFVSLLLVLSYYPDS